MQIWRKKCIFLSSKSRRGREFAPEQRIVCYSIAVPLDRTQRAIQIFRSKGEQKKLRIERLAWFCIFPCGYCSSRVFFSLYPCMYKNCCCL
jgi:hypothetical protein